MLDQPRLYILMRTDMDYSMSPGRKMAQASHAANQAQTKILSKGFHVADAFRQWLQEADGFGTAIVLGCTDAEIKDVHFMEGHCRKDMDCGVVHDPEYWIKDGDTAHQIAVDTCAWIFGSPSNAMVLRLTEGLELHP